MREKSQGLCKCRVFKSYVNAGYSNHIDSNLCLCYYYLDAAVAQVVAHLIGSEEVTGPSPVSSLSITLDFTRVIFYVLYLELYVNDFCLQKSSFPCSFYI